MKFTFKKIPLDKAMLGANGTESNPYKALEFVLINDEEEPLDDLDRLAFIEENYPTLLALCAEAHEAWKADNVPGVLH